MREKLLLKLAEWHSSHPWRMVVIVVLLTLVFGWFAEHLSVTMRWADLLPSGDKRTIQFNKVIDEFSSATSLVVVVQGEETRIKEFADQLAPQILELVDTSDNKKSEKQKDFKLFHRIDYKMEADFLKNHGLLLIKEADLKNIKDMFLDPNLKGLVFNLNNAMEKEYVGQEESISTREKEDQAVALLDGIQGLVNTLKRAALGEDLTQEEIEKTVDQFLIGDPYFLSYDQSALVMNVIPNFSMLDLDYVVSGTDQVQGLVDELLKEFPGLEAGLTGFIAVGRDEMVYSQKGLGYTTAIALVAILFLLVISFRMWAAPLLAIGNLMIGLIWAVGLAAVVVGQLNIMTQMMAVILLGLGIDFSIHLMSGFTEWRAAGFSIHQALEKTFLKSGKGILTGGMTTSAAFLALVISHSRGMKEMGLVTGFGLLAILLSTMIFMPVLLVFRERRMERKLKKKAKKPLPKKDITFRFLGRTSSWLAKRYVFTIAASILVTVLFIWSGLQIPFDHNYMNIEPKGLISIKLQDTVLEKFDMGMDYAMILTENPQESRQKAERLRDLGSVARTEDISLYLPSQQQQKKRAPYLTEIRKSIQSRSINQVLPPEEISELNQEIDRLQMNIMELQDMAFLGGQDKVDNKCKQIVGIPGEPDSKNIIQDLLEVLGGDPTLISSQLSKFQQTFSPYFKESVIQMSSTDPIHLDELPSSILDRYSNPNRDQFLITAFPNGDIWKNAKFLVRFVDDLERVSDKATGMPPVFKALIEVIGRDGQNAMLLTLVVVFLLLSVDFRNPLHSLMAMIPLAFGVFWMVGIMKISGMMLTVMNVMAFPLIIGIGIDDGVHIVHRWRNEGKGKIGTVFSSTGKAILLTSLTTMLAFGSLVFSIWRGFGHLGGALFIGVGACFLTTVIILSGIFGLLKRKKQS
ncbi:MAG: MMPL family transporter [Candidatus Aminicenantes bacterium]|nr:MMPL family transporter [Candidatus Aminicenantes bacterium]